MKNLSYIGLSQQMALQRLMEVTANNMANMSTPGFKAQHVLFSEYLNKAADENGAALSQVQSTSSWHDLSSGTLSRTENPLDVAVQGDGWLAVSTPAGTRYTRNGAFTLNARREIVTKAGDQVMSEGGGPLVIPEDGTRITISDNGEVSTEKGAIGKLKVTDFENPAALQPAGDNLYSAEGTQEKPLAKPQVAQGMIESSNVQPIVEMNKMIEIMRLYQAAQNMLLNDHEEQRTMIQKLTKTQ